MALGVPILKHFMVFRNRHLSEYESNLVKNWKYNTDWYTYISKISIYSEINSILSY